MLLHSDPLAQLLFPKLLYKQTQHANSMSLRSSLRGVSKTLIIISNYCYQPLVDSNFNCFLSSLLLLGYVSLYVTKTLTYSYTVPSAPSPHYPLSEAPKDIGNVGRWDGMNSLSRTIHHLNYLVVLHNHLRTNVLRCYGEPTSEVYLPNSSGCA